MKSLLVSVVVTMVVAAMAAPVLATADSVGLQDPSTGKWFVSDTEGDVTEFFFGNPGDFPFLGDWDCNGVATPGLYRQSDGFVYLRNSNTVGTADVEFFFGDPGDVPIAGDFNNDGCDTVSIYRPSNQTFYIINKLGSKSTGLGAAETSFVFGDPGDKPVTGDWDGDGITEIGLHRETTGFFYWRNTLQTGNADGQIFFGDPNDRFVAGDWGIVDGVDTPAIFRPTNATFFFRHTLTEGNADSTKLFGSGFMLPVAGNTGDVVDDSSDVLRTRPDVAAELVALVNASRAGECGGVAALTASAAVASVAEAHSADMVTHGFFDHTSPTTGTPFDRLNAAAIPWTAAGENIGQASSAAVIHNLWMNSPGHRANICSTAFGTIGIGVIDNFGQLTATQVFTN